MDDYVIRDRPNPPRQHLPPHMNATAAFSQPHLSGVVGQTASRPVSESWSDDSSYLKVGSRCNPTDVTGSPAGRVHEWLLAICDNDTKDRANDLDED
ncbi:hypothetical protein M3J09_003585 [Ascochyta lentis]